jgi:hypothetical protein
MMNANNGHLSSRFLKGKLLDKIVAMLSILHSPLLSPFGVLIEVYIVPIKIHGPKDRDGGNNNTVGVKNHCRGRNLVVLFCASKDNMTLSNSM